jgi:hypothetical protein
MNKVATILLFVALWAGNTRSLAFHLSPQTLDAEEKLTDIRAIRGHREWSIIFVLRIKTDDSSGTDSAEEESEDEDNTSKENVFNRMTSLHLSFFLQQLYYRQNAIFKEHHPEVEAPPPRS